MSRVACFLGFSLGVFSVVTGILGGPELMARLVIVFGGLLMVVSVLAFRGCPIAQGVMSFFGLLALARSLPIFFQTTELWPNVPFILGGSLTMGLGVLGILLDRFGPGSNPDSPSL
jgi:hypothetical protein